MYAASILKPVSVSEIKDDPDIAFADLAKPPQKDSLRRTHDKPWLYVYDPKNRRCHRRCRQR